VAYSLAELHRAAAGFIPASGSRARVDWGRWMEKFKAQAIFIKKHKEQVETKENPGRFDRLFLKYADECYERMYCAYLILKDNRYMEMVHESMSCNQLAHKEFRKHAVLMSEEGQLFITNMENCGYDIREVDIATLLESFSGKDKEELADAALRAYAGLIPLDAASVNIIQAFLIEPKRFYKVIQRYYGRKKNYTEVEFISKLESSIKKEHRKDGLIELLEGYTI
jgi:spore coat protein I